MSDDWVSDTVGALADPIIVYESAWKDTLPEWIRGEIKMQRILQLAVAQQDESQRDIATDAEALAYMYPLTLERPISSDWTEIYLYLGTRVMSKNMPDDIRRDSLTDYQMQKLTDLKRWIYRKRVEARKAKERGERREAREEGKARVVKKEDTMQQMFPF